MDKLRPLLVAVPAFALGSLLAASLTTTARAQDPSRRVSGESFDVRRERAASPYEYTVVTNEVDLNRAARQGYEYVGQSSAAGYQSSVETRYTMRRERR